MLYVIDGVCLEYKYISKYERWEGWAADWWFCDFIVIFNDVLEVEDLILMPGLAISDPHSPKVKLPVGLQEEKNNQQLSLPLLSRSVQPHATLSPSPFGAPALFLLWISHSQQHAERDRLISSDLRIEGTQESR